MAVSDSDETQQRTTARALAAERSRAAFLDIGVRVLSARLGSPVDAIRAQDVVAEIDLTTGAFYHHWRTQDDYRTDLRQHVVANLELRQTLDRFMAALPEFEGNIADLIGRTFVDEVRSVAAQPTWWLEVAMMAGGVQDDLDGLHVNLEAWVSRLCNYYSAVADAFGLRLQPGFTIEGVVRTLMALVDGFSLQMRVGFDLDMGGNSDDWTAVELGVASVLVTAFEEPRSADGRDVKERFRAMFEAERS